MVSKLMFQRLFYIIHKEILKRLLENEVLSVCVMFDKSSIAAEQIP